MRGTLTELAAVLSDMELRSAYRADDMWHSSTGIELAQTGAFLGRMKINRTIELSQDGQSFTFRGSSTVLDANGNVVVSVPASGSGQRLQVEQQS